MTEAAMLVALDDILAWPVDRRWDEFAAHVPTSDHESVLLALGDAAEAAANAEVRRGVLAAGAVVALADAAALPVAEARARRALAIAMAHGGQFAEALVACEEAIRLADAAGARVEAARARLASAQPNAHLGRFEAAVAASSEALALLTDDGESELAARAHLNLGATWAMRDQPERALAHFDAARATLTDPLLLAQIASNRGNALMALDRLADAEAAFGEAVARFESLQIGWGAAVAEGNLAYLTMRQGRLPDCLTHFERARRFFEQDDAVADVARLDAEQADALATLGLPTDALAAFAHALPALEAQGLTVEAALSRLGQAHLLLRLGRVEEAATALDRAEPALRDADLTTSLARLASLRAEVALAEGDLARARRDVATARDALADRPIQAALIDLIAARVALAGNDATAARRLIEQAAPPLEDAGIAPVLGDLYHLLGSAELARGDTDAAQAAFRRAVAEIERVRGSLQAERLRSAFLGDRLGAHEQLFTLALDREGGAAEAFVTAERARSRALLDALAAAPPPTAVHADALPGEAALVHELETHRAWLNWYYSQLGVGAEPSPHQRAEQAAHEQALASLTVRLAVAGGPASLWAPPAALEEIQPVLPAGTALVSYMIARGHLHAIVVTRRGAVPVPRLVPAREIDDRVQRLHFQLNRALVARHDRRRAKLLDDCRRELGGLHDILLAPLARYLDAIDQLVAVPFGALHAVPFAALWDGTAYQVEQRTVLTVPSASVLPTLSARARRTPVGSPLVFGVPDDRAPHMGSEATTIADGLSGARAIVGDAATADRLLGGAASASLLHLACHGRFLPDAPLASGLRLADRWLSVGELSRLRTEASLVTLSGCETGKSLVTAGDELVGLVRTMLASGAGALLVSLWMSHDETTTAVMSQFYQHLESGVSRAAALRRAQLDALTANPHPAYWAPFILIDRPPARPAVADPPEGSI